MSKTGLETGARHLVALPAVHRGVDAAAAAAAAFSFIIKCLALVKA